MSDELPATPDRADAPPRTPTPKRKPPQGAPMDDPKPWRTEGLDDQKGDSSDSPERPKLNPWRYAIIWMLVFVVILSVVRWMSTRDVPPAIGYTDFVAQVQANNIKSIHAKGDSIDGELKQAQVVPADVDATGNQNKVTYTKFTTERPTWATDDLWTTLQKQNVLVSATPVYQEQSIWMTLAQAILPWVLLIGIWVWFMRRMTKGGGFGGLMGGMGRDVKPIEKDKVRVNFTDVAGIDEVRDQVQEIVDFLKSPEKYRRVGAHAPKGVLLEGAPGTGKTLLARATAGEAEVPFFTASASEFIEMIVGVGAQRVRQLFDEARKAAPSIIFIDEIDAIGRSRASSRSLGGNDEREQTLNQVLTEMDGFDGTEGVVVMAATNRADVLDAALTRPGRFDRVITVNTPDLEGRAQILGVHTRNIPTAPDVDLHAIAASTPGMTGADLANLANEAALLAAKRADTLVYQRDFTNALEKVQLGVARQVVIPENEKRRTAYHEAGHALLGMLQKGADPVRKVSIIPRGQALGVTLSTPDTDKYGYDRDYLMGRIVGALGGMAAESVIFGVVTTGAESDLSSATAIARQMVGKWGMSEKIGPMQVLNDSIDPRTNGIAEETLGLLDEETRRIIGECHEKAAILLREHRDQLEAIVVALLEHETLDEEQVYAAAGIERPEPSPEVVAALAKARGAIEAAPAGDGAAGAMGTPDSPGQDPSAPPANDAPVNPARVPDAPWAPPDPSQIAPAG
ncbi:MAG: ATP-dependent zinc metalloprotease FtsH [Propionibacteriaceae bacterium]|nr:ATP-dependent zinc metalloprotease FtsH [Propionibacteriaceae bacterium]